MAVPNQKEQSPLQFLQDLDRMYETQAQFRGDIFGLEWPSTAGQFADREMANAMMIRGHEGQARTAVLWNGLEMLLPL